MKYIKDLKNKTLLLIVAVIGLTFGIIGVSYSVFMQLNHSEHTIKTGTLNVVFNKGTAIGESMLPMSNEAGLAQTTGYTFSVENKGTLFAKYNIKIKSGAGNQVGLDQIYVSLCNASGGSCDGASLLSDKEVDSEDASFRLIKKDVHIAGGVNEKHSYMLKLWIRSDASETLSSKPINLSMEIESVVKD